MWLTSAEACGQDLRNAHLCEISHRHIEELKVGRGIVQYAYTVVALVDPRPWIVYTQYCQSLATSEHDREGPPFDMLSRTRLL
jgi:hypothetical protein